MVGVLPDVPALDRVLDYVVPEGWSVQVGGVVRVPLQQRRARGWVVEVDRDPPAGVALRPIAKVSSLGPEPALVELSTWAAWRWAGRRTTFLRAGTPLRAVHRLPARSAGGPPALVAPAGPVADLARAGLDRGLGVLRLPPSVDPLPLVLAAAALGQALVLVPGQQDARRLVSRLRRAGARAVHHPEGWAEAAGGTTVVGSRAAAWAPAPALAAVVVLDEHDERYQDERAPTWNARDVAVERARRAGVPCLLVSPVPTLAALALVEGRACTLPRADERRAWPVVELVDRRRDADPLRHGLYSPELVARLRAGGVAALVLNRRGRAKLLACASCGALGTCDRCGAALAAPDRDRLVCPRCAAERPVVCAACGATRLKLLRPGVSRAREELEALLGEPVAEVTGDSGDLPAARVRVGTQALLHRLDTADLVAFLDLDADLSAPRYRAAEQVLARLALAARRLGGRGGSRLLVQTRQPHHDVLRAVLLADPSRFSRPEAQRRADLRLPPTTAIAVVSGPGAEELATRVRHRGGEVRGPADGAYQVRAASSAELSDVLAAAGRPASRVRVAVDPLDA